MASLLDIVKKLTNLYSNFGKGLQSGTKDVGRSVLNRTQSVGKNYINPILRKPVSPSPVTKSLESFYNTNNPAVRLPLQFTSSYMQGANLGLGRPLYTPPKVRGEGLTSIAGSLAGAFNPRSITGRTVGAITKATNPILARTLKPISGPISSRVGAGIANVAQGGVINPAFGQKPFTPGSMALDFATGVAFGPKQFGGTSQMTKAEYKTLSDHIQTLIEKRRNLVKEGASKVAIRQYDDAIKQAESVLSNRRIAEGGVLGIKGKTKGVAQAGISDITKEAQISQPGKQLGITQPSSILESQRPLTQPKLQSELPSAQRVNIGTKEAQPLDNIIAEGRKQIGGEKPVIQKSIKQHLDDLYTQWVDRYNPLSKASGKAKAELKKQGAVLRPEYDPEYLVRRLTGAGGIADQRFKTELNPILKQMEQANIPKLDMDVYLANKRMAGFGEVGRTIKGADPVKAKQIVQALDQKYPGIGQIADQFYKYQDVGFQELIDSGFISEDVAKVIKGQNPDYAPLYRVMDEIDDYLGLPTRKTMQGTSPIKKIKGSERQIQSPVESVIGNTFQQRAAIEKNNVAKSLVKLQEITDLGFKKASKSGLDTITVWNNGKKEFWQVGREIADVAKGTNEESMNLLLKIIQQPAALLRQGATGRNPEFMIPNVVRDQLDAGITSKYGYIPFVDYVSGLKSMLTKDDVYRKWEQSGAKIDLGELSGRKSVSKMFSEKTSKKKLSDWISQGLDVLGKYSEQPTRVGLFKKAYNKTGNTLLSAMESRDATVDFARMGSKMKVANSIIPFLNVGVQGFDKLMRSIKNNPGKVLLNMGIYGATPAAAITAYNLTNHPDEYAEIPEYEKQSNFVLVQGRNADGTVDYLTFPKGNVLPVVTNPIQSFMEYAYNVDGESFGEMATNVLSGTLPVLGQGSSLKEVAVKTIGSNLPQAIKPITENLVNKSFYKYDPNKEQSKEIVPYYLQNKPAYQQKYDFTPQMYQKIGAVFNVSPLQVKNLMEGYLAGYSKIPAQAVEMLYKVSKNEPISPNDKTILRRFMKQTYESSGSKPQPSVETPGFMQRVTGQAGASELKPIPTRTQELEVLYKDALRTVNSYPENKTKAQYGLVNKTLEEYQSEFDTANAMLKRIRKEQPEKVFEIEVEAYSKTGSAATEDRAKWAAEQLSNGVDIEKLYKGQVLTKTVVEALNETYGLDLDKYNYGTGFRTLSGTGSGKKITVSSPKITPFKLSQSPKFKFSKLPAPPAIKTKPTKAEITLPKAEAYKPKINIPVRWL